MSKAFDTMITDKLGGEVKSDFAKNVRVDCPNCGSRKLYVHREKGICHCFKCEYSASAVGLVADLEGCSYHEAVEYVENMEESGKLIAFRKSGQSIKERILEAILGIEEEEESDSIDLPEGCIPFKKTEGERYLRGRGYKTYKIEGYKLLYCNESQPEDKLDTEGHIIFPDYDPKDQEAIRFWTTRATWEPKHGGTKSFHSPGIDKVCFGLWAVPWQQRGIVIVEGPLDVLACGFGNAVAILGSSITEAQCMEMAPRFKWAVIALDSEAWEESLEVARRLKQYGIETWCAFLEDGDPGNLVKAGGSKANRALIKNNKVVPPHKYLKQIAEKYTPGLVVKQKLAHRND